MEYLFPLEETVIARELMFDEISNDIKKTESLLKRGMFSNFSMDVSSSEYRLSWDLESRRILCTDCEGNQRALIELPIVDRMTVHRYLDDFIAKLITNNQE